MYLIVKRETDKMIKIKSLLRKDGKRYNMPRGMIMGMANKATTSVAYFVNKLKKIALNT